ncbi:glycosyl hydrolase [Pseudomonas nitroreducens]|uniref:Glycoside hydrolase family 99-like domain-containing protein n=2 Tax=Pseudomonas nitroreducens TaxID=46680 RepID=A0A6G6J7A5_PSENT|nr:glycoside hydrolase family 99-like domain-containing protein [Pseudomonas nitroreducens]MBG6290915.1 glycoside hydrolase family 99-like domain-containing protein [Pseudomonas nitroreducens]NMZ60756.1 glycosyl hydrolase [Pseudomonas nitroreducens]QIE91083.1 glycosyl hydrolase [Pseudomonas nitroreducens]SNT44400.1 Glycosyltransferase WbsX [Pseudomonas nitroreducens]
MIPVTNDPSFAALSRREEGAKNDLQRDAAKLLAFYLPQYHRVKENSEWWGPGFTEWTNVARGKPNFKGHYQPHIPRDLGFYDLSHPDVMFEQAEMAKLYGLHGFCFYHYWFSGRRILERPVDNFLKTDIDLNFCLCWANENWTRTWDGDTKSVLLAQNYAEDDDAKFIESLLPYFNDKRYIRVNGKPLLVVYRAKDIPSASSSFAKWRQMAQELGFPGLHIAVVDFYDISTASEVDADALVEFPPHKFNGPGSSPDQPPALDNPEFAGSLVDYTKVVAQSLRREAPPFKLYRGIIPSWDNTARRQNTPTTLVNANPEAYGEWLRYLRAYTRQNLTSNEDNFIFINAWNEWGEGCHLEPDQKWELRYLEQTLKSAYYNEAENDLAALREGQMQKLAQIQARHQLPSDRIPTATTESIAQQLTEYQSRPHSAAAFVAARRLNQWPLLYKIARLGYRTVRRIRG